MMHRPLILLGLLSLGLSVPAFAEEGPCLRGQMEILEDSFRARPLIRHSLDWNLSDAMMLPDLGAFFAKAEENSGVREALLSRERGALRLLEKAVEARLQQWREAKVDPEATGMTPLWKLENGLRLFTKSVGDARCLFDSKSILSNVYEDPALQKEALVVAEGLSAKVRDFKVESKIQKIRGEAEKIQQKIRELGGQPGMSPVSCDRGGPVLPGAGRSP